MKFRRNFVFILVTSFVIIIDIIIIVVVVVSTSFLTPPKFVSQQYSSSVGQVIIFIIIGIVGGGIGLLLSIYPRFRKLRKRKLKKQRDLKGVFKTRPRPIIYDRLAQERSLQIQEMYEQKLRQLELEKQQLELEKQRLELVKQEQSLGWQKEAVMLADVSPRAAIIIAWLGIEKEIRRAVIQADTFEGISPSTSEKLRVWGSNKIIQSLKNKGIISAKTLATLVEMRDLRDKLAHNIEVEEVSEATALNYVEHAISIAEEISSFLKK